MDEEYKARIIKATEKSISKLEKHKTVRSGKNKTRNAPEKKLEKEIVPWLKSSGFDMSVVDSSEYGVWFAKKTSESMPDMVGDLELSDALVPAYIELKAPGSRGRVSVPQWLFLKRKISRGAFGCVTDSIEHIRSLLNKWLAGGRDPMILLDDLPMNAEIKRYLEDESKPLSFD